MRKHLITRILSILLMVSLVLVEIGPILSYGLEASDAQAPTETEEETGTEPLKEEEASTEEPEEGAQQTEEEIPEDGTEPPDQQEETDTDQDVPDEEGTEQPEEPEQTEEEPQEVPSDEPEDPTEDTPEQLPVEELPEEETTDEEELTPEQQAEQEAMETVETILQRALSLRSSDVNYSYATELAKFPASYQTYLKELHEQHPNWIFVAVDTGLEWDEVIEGELGEQSTLDYTYSDLLLNNHTGYYSTTGYTSTNGYRPIDGSHVSCSRAALSYYMDPRNFLIDKYIFQFEDQRFNKNVQQLAGVQTILKNACSYSTGLYNMTTYVTTSGNKASLSSLNSKYGSNYSSIIYNVGLAIGISPYFLASKIAQETGANTTNGSISGTYPGYTGYYNFYNIGAYASANGGAIAKGLSYAKSKGWSNPILSIYGGAEFIYNQYIGKGQNTIYYMRFNVGPEASYNLYTHQYMSATYAVAGEATKTYNAYKEVGAVDNAFLFYIPVFRNMPDQTSKVSLTPTTTGKTNVSCGLYAGPSTSTTKQVQIPSGATVTVLSGSVTTTDNYTSRLAHPYWYQVRVTVSGKTYTGYVDEENVNLSAVYDIKRGSTKSLSSVVSTSGKTGTLYYETSDPAIATVSDSGVITAKGNGTCSIYVISGGGSFDAIGIKVSNTGSNIGSGDGVPLAPGITSVVNGDGYIRVAWEKISNATGYTVWRKAGSAAAWTKIATVSSGSTIVYNDTKVSNNTTYTYTIRAVNSYGASDYDHTGKQILYLQTPKLTHAKAYSDGIGVQWESVSGATSYDLYRKTSSDGWRVLANVSASSGNIQGYTDGTASKGTTYYYTVRAKKSSSQSYYKTSGVHAASVTTQPIQNAYAISSVNYRTGAGTSYPSAGTFASGALVQIVPGNTVSSGGSTWYQVRVNGGSVYYVNGDYLLLIPGSQKATNINGGIRVTWEASDQVTGYVVYRKTASTGWVRLGTSIVNRFDDSTPDSGTTYFYTVRAVSGSKMSDYNRSGVSCLCLDTPRLTSAKANGNAIQVSWNKVTGAAGYTVWRKTGNETAWTKIATLSSGSTISYTDHSVENGINYTYTVRAINGSTMSQYDRTGVSAKLSGTVSVEDQVVKTAASYYSTMNISSAAAGKLSAGTVVKVVTGWSQTSGGVTWRKVQVNSKYYYIQAGHLLATPSLTGAVNTTSGIQVTWSKESVGNGYTVWRKAGNAAAWSKIATISSNSTVSYVDKSVTSGTTYAYTVRAAYGSVQSRYSTKGISCLCLDTPDLGSAKASSSGITVTWGKVSGAASYLVYRKTAGASWQRIAQITATSYADKANLTSGVTYYYTVRAYQGGYLSGYDTAGVSAKATATTATETLVNYVTTGMLNYRSSPDKSSSSNIMGTLASGVTVKVVSGWSKQVDDTLWYKCYINGHYYYLSSKYLKKA